MIRKKFRTEYSQILDVTIQNVVIWTTWHPVFVHPSVIVQLNDSIECFGGLGVACSPLVPKFAGSNPAEAVGKILSTPSFGGEVKPSVPCRRFAECKRSLNLRGSRNLGKITTGHLSRPQFHLSLLGSLASLQTEAPGG